MNGSTSGKKSKHNFENIILGGDFNLIKNAKLDKEGGILGTSHPKALTEVEKIQINLDLGDIWRDQNPLFLHGEGVIHLYPADLTFFF